jgi:hypothetical protein
VPRAGDEVSLDFSGLLDDPARLRAALDKAAELAGRPASTGGPYR